MSNFGCINKYQILNGNINCEDGSDEACKYEPILPYEYAGKMFLCESEDLQKRLIELQTVKGEEAIICQEVNIFSTMDGQNTEIWCRYSYSIIETEVWNTVRCENGHFIQGAYLCLQQNTCQDGSENLKDVPGFKCKAKGVYRQSTESCVLPQINLYNSLTYCADDSDNCFIDGKLKCFKCLDGKLLLSPNQVCDGIIDCFDLSDECLCDDQEVCSDVVGNSREVCRFNEILCTNKCMSVTEIICNKQIYCRDNINMKFCVPSVDQPESTIICEVYGGSSVTVNKCDGIPECWNREDECVDCEVKSHFCDVDIACHHDMLIHNILYCDGVEKPVGFGKQSWKCKHGFDEVNCPNRYYCKNGNDVSISESKICDGVINCDDGSDELETKCRKLRFYCLNNIPPSIALDKVEDGIKDCTDGSDECPPNGNRVSLFSSSLEMISNALLRAIVWIMGIVAFIGNAMVITGSAMDFKKSKSSIASASHWFVLNLSVSDFLMSVYLISISIKGVMFSGTYCYHDLEWRSSTLCSFLGALMIVSTEASALIMTSMTTFRLLSVLHPIRMQNVGWKSYCLPAFLSWIIAVLLATIPLITESSGYFVSSLWFPNYFYSKQAMRKSDINQLVGRMGEITNISYAKLNWYQLKQTLAVNFESLSVNGEFGYYSGTSVCMPRLFVKVGDDAREYSTMLISLNLLMFLYMVASYVVIYKKGTEMNNNQKERRNKNLQKRISRLIVTNFLCWMPICVFSYISLAGVTLHKAVYEVSAGFLLPINSTINPILYSTLVEETYLKIFQSVKHSITRNNSSKVCCTNRM
ncbi:uncharacterized protein LOC144747763 [Ciona intestinalis]